MNTGVIFRISSNFIYLARVLVEESDTSSVQSGLLWIPFRAAAFRILIVIKGFSFRFQKIIADNMEGWYCSNKKI